MKYQLTILLMSAGMISCNNVKDDHKSIESLNNDSSVIHKTEGLIEKYEDQNFQSKTIALYSPDKTIIESFYEKQQPKILRINKVLKNEDGLIDTFTEVFYFGEDGGFPIVYTFGNREVSRQVITKERNVVSYLRENGKITYVNQLDSFVKETKISAITFLLTSYIIHIDGLNYKMPKPSLNSIPVIITLKDSIMLYKEPDVNSDEVRLLTEGERLFFIGYDRKHIPWLNIATEDKKINGWIIGDSSVKYYTDGD